MIINNNKKNQNTPETFNDFCSKWLGFKYKPHHESTIIPFSIKAFSANFLHSCLTIYDLRGRRVLDGGHIYLPEGPQEFYYQEGCEESIGREQAIMELCGMKVDNLDIYNYRNGYYLLSSFPSAFEHHSQFSSYSYPVERLKSYSGHSRQVQIEVAQHYTYMQKEYIVKSTPPETQQAIKEYVHVLLHDSRMSHQCVGTSIIENFSKIANETNLPNWLNIKYKYHQGGVLIL